MMNNNMGGLMSRGGAQSQQQMNYNLIGVMSDDGSQSDSQPLSMGGGRSGSRPLSQQMGDCDQVGEMSAGESQSQQPSATGSESSSQPQSQQLVSHSSGGEMTRGGSQSQLLVQSQPLVNDGQMGGMGGGGAQGQLQQRANHSPGGLMSGAPQSRSQPLMNCNLGGVMSEVAKVDFAEEQYSRAKTSVWWDIENCPAPKTGHPHNIAQNISSALMKLNYCGPLSISAYGDTARISPVVQQALNSTGISLNHVPADAKDASDKKILVGMLLWAVDNPAPANYLLISGDRDFSDALHQLRMRRYNILLAQPRHASASLVAAAKSVWLWTSLSAGGPPISSVEASQIVNNGYGFASSSQPSTMRSIQTSPPLGSFRYRSVQPENQEISKVTPSRHHMVTRHKKHTLGIPLFPSRKIKKMLAQKFKHPKCNRCHKLHIDPCPHENLQCFNCGEKGHVRKDCSTTNQNTTPGHVFAMIEGGDEAHHANVTGALDSSLRPNDSSSHSGIPSDLDSGLRSNDLNTHLKIPGDLNLSTPADKNSHLDSPGTTQKAEPPKCNRCHKPHFAPCLERIRCYNCRESGHVMRNCRKLKLNTAPGHVFSMIQGSNEVHHANITAWAAPYPLQNYWGGL